MSGITKAEYDALRKERDDALSAELEKAEVIESLRQKLAEQESEKSGLEKELTQLRRKLGQQETKQAKGQEKLIASLTESLEKARANLATQETNQQKIFALKLAQEQAKTNKIKTELKAKLEKIVSQINTGD